MGEGQDNGFVERPAGKPNRLGGVVARLRETATNGKAIRIAERGSVSGSYHRTFKAEGLRLRTAKQPDGTFLAWCERIDAASGASRPEGARP